LPQRKEPKGSWGLEELEEILAVTSKSRRLGGAESYNRQMLKTFLQRSEERNKL